MQPIRGLTSPCSLWHPSRGHPSLSFIIRSELQFIPNFSSPDIARTRYIFLYTTERMKAITYGTRQMNRLLDDTLMNTHPFPSQTLMELAGVACAQVANRILGRKRDQEKLTISQQSITVLVGPGNNGGDGLVAARHLAMMHYPVDIVTFKELQGKNGIYQTLCNLNSIPHFSHQAFQDQNIFSREKFISHLANKSLIIDGIFGFPFQGQIRQPYRDFLGELAPFQERIFSIDIPSGWDANDGNVHNLFTPAYLISLGMPKKCSEGFKGEHYFGGRFIPEKIRKELEIELPEFEGDALYCRL